MKRTFRCVLVFFFVLVIMDLAVLSVKGQEEPPYAYVALPSDPTIRRAGDPRPEAFIDIELGAGGGSTGGTFVFTMGENMFFGPEHVISTFTLGPWIGVKRWISYSPLHLPIGTDLITVVATLESTGEVLDTGSFTLVIVGPPVADAGGPYTTSEGVPVILDASGSSDPLGEPLTYEWDLDNDGAYDDATGVTATFATVGQDGVFPIGLRVVASDGAEDTDGTDITVINAAPSTSLSSNAPKDEGSMVTVKGVVTDPGWLDSLTATIDWGDGSLPETIVGALENVKPDATLSFSVSHVYGDNGNFLAEVHASDDDTTTSNSIELQISNVAPTAEIDVTGAILVNGVPTFIAHVGEPIAFSGRTQDPGSDDLSLSWDWADGSPSPDVTTVYLVNPPNPDPFPSPSLQPRDVTDTHIHAFTAAGLYQVTFRAGDDDGGASLDTVNVIITGTESAIRTAGYWMQQCSNARAKTMAGYLNIVGYMSQVFNEVRDASTIRNAYDVLYAKNNRGSMTEIFDRQLLALWLNFASGSLKYDRMFDLNGDHIPESSFAAVVAKAEAVRLDPSSTRTQLEQQKNILELINSMGK